MFKRIVFILFVFVFVVSIKSAFCFDEETTCGLKEVGFFTGYAHGDLKEPQHNYEMYLAGVRFGWNIKPWVGFIEFPEESLFEFVLEPYANTIISPHTNGEFGNAFFFKYGHKIMDQVKLYIEVGSGMQYMTQHTLEQSTQFNFASAGGAGFYYYIRDDLAINGGYRFRHMSNCGIDHPNSGINTQHYIIGLSWMY